jgi:formamidopyrimidine-DNA glycosylase
MIKDIIMREKYLKHKVHGRAGEDCLDCGTELKKVVAGGRTTVYCPTCQR